MYKILASFLIPITVFSAVDTDMDGVMDSIDKCPNTSIIDLVDISGCTIETLVSPHRYNISIGESYSEFNSNNNEKSETYTSTLQVGYMFENYSILASMSHFSSENDSGLGDTTLSLGYSYPMSENLRLSLGLGVFLPTYKSSLNNNHTDYAFSFNTNYKIDKINLFAGYRKTINNDDDVLNVVDNQNTDSFNVGVGYYVGSKVYVSGSYSTADSSSKGTEDIQKLSSFVYYSLDEKWSVNMNYSHGLSDSASNHYVSIGLGYSF